MAYVIGIDIGTSFTAAAIARPDSDSRGAPQQLNLGIHGGAVPTVVFLAEDGSVLVGEAAERRGLDQPHRVLREFKRRVGDTVPIVVGDIVVTAEDVFATMARWVVDRAEEQEGAPPEAVTLSHPASWGPYKTGLIRTALAGVGLADVTLLSEPEAAALHYAAAERVETGKTIAVYDLGGGTFDVAILTKDDNDSFRTLGRPAGIERMGGADFTEAVFRFVAENVGDAFTALDLEDPGVLVALTRVRRECVEAKESLSFDSEATIPVLLPGVHTQLRLVRSEFEAMIERPVRETITTLTRAMKVAGVEADDLAAILLIGGSSRIPLVAQLLSVELNRPLAIDADPKASISLGAAFFGAKARRAAADLNIEPVAATSDGPTHVDHVPSPSAAHSPHFGDGAAAFVPPTHAHSKPIYARTRVRLGAVSVVVAGLIVLAGTAPRTATDAGLLAAGSAAQANEAPAGAAATPAAAPQAAGPGPTAPEVSPGSDPSPFSSSDPGNHGQDLGPSTPPSQRPPASNEAGPAPSPAPVAQTNADAATPPGSTPAPAPAPAPAPTSEPTPNPVPTTPAQEPTPTPTPDPALPPSPSPNPTPSPAPEPTTPPQPTAVPVEPAPQPAPVEQIPGPASTPAAGL